MTGSIIFRMAYRNLRRHFSRSTLAALGIIIGVVAVTTIGILGSGLQITVSAQLSGVASDVLVMPVYSHSEYISEKQFRIIEKIPIEGNITPIKQDMLGNVRKGAYSETFRASVLGMDVEQAKNMWELKSGKWPTGNRKEALVGEKFVDDRNVRIGSTLRMNGTSFTITGIIKKVEGAMISYTNPNNAIVINGDNFDQIFSISGYSFVIISVKDIEVIDEAEDYLESRLNKKKDTISIMVMRDITESITSVFGMLALVLSAIGGISLVVAGISILNVMLISVMERIKEIGVMRAIGAYKSEVTRMFIYETLVLGIVASVIGAALSILCGYFINSMILTAFFGPKMMEQTGLTIFSLLFNPLALLSIAEGFLIGITVTFVSGLYPAVRAARMSPVEALRYE